MTTKCRTCGCTSENCLQCIAKTGAPCWWVERDLCSACSDRNTAFIHLTTQLAGDVIRAYLMHGAVLAVIDARGQLHVGGASVPGPATQLASEVTGVLAALAKKRFGTIVEKGPHDTAACIHCREFIAAADDVESIKRHTVTCPENPLVREIAAAKARIAKLEVELGDALHERNELQLEHDRSARHG